MTLSLREAIGGWAGWRVDEEEQERIACHLFFVTAIPSTSSSTSSTCQRVISSTIATLSLIKVRRRGGRVGYTEFIQGILFVLMID
jgi:hypothetical protein